MQLTFAAKKNGTKPPFQILPYGPSSQGGDENLLGYTSAKAQRSTVDSNQTGRPAPRTEQFHFHSRINPHGRHTTTEVASALDARDFDALARFDATERQDSWVRYPGSTAAALVVSLPAVQHNCPPPLNIIVWCLIRYSKLYKESIVFFETLNILGVSRLWSPILLRDNIKRGFVGASGRFQASQRRKNAF